MHINDLPEEILDRIVASLDSPIDLENLAVVCLKFNSLVEPYHTQFRVIRTPLISPLWQELAGNQLLAQNIRILEVQPAEVDEDSAISGLDPPVVPAIFSHLDSLSEVPEPDSDEEDPVGTRKAYDAAKNAKDLEAERMLVSALKGMSGLTSFQWKRTPPLINPTQEDDIWITLAKYCPSLTSIEVFDREKPYDYVLEERDDRAYQRPTLNSNFYLFQDLKLFSLKTVAFDVRNFPFPIIEPAGEMLVQKCPRLEILKLVYIMTMNPHSRFVKATPLLSNASWVSLREVTLSGFSFISTELCAFLVSHPTIEVISLLSIQLNESLVLPTGVLPLLKRLSVDLNSAIVHSVLDSSTTSLPRPLEAISWAFLNGVFLDTLENSGRGSILKELCCTCTSSDAIDHFIGRLSTIAPNLDYLRISNLYPPKPVDPSMYSLFGQFPKLRILTGVRFIGSGRESASENNEKMRALVAICPNLRRISWFIGNYQFDLDTIVVIEHHGSHVTWCLVKAWAGQEGSISTSWGEGSHGSFEL